METDENEVNANILENDLNGSMRDEYEINTRILENVWNPSKEGENETNPSILEHADESRNKFALTEVTEINHNNKTEDLGNVTFSLSQENSDFDFLDPGTWPPQISDTQRCFIIRMRTGREEDPDLSQSMRDSRSLTKEWFFKKLPNGNKIKRSWLVYSSSKNALFCVPCRLFSQKVNDSETNLSSLVKDE